MSDSALSQDKWSLIIKPLKPWWQLDFGELWRFRETLYFLVWRNVKIRYKQTFLGCIWVVLQPLAAAAIFTVVFSYMAGLPSDGIQYPLFSFSGLVIWTYFSNAMTFGASCLTADANLIRRIYFPRVILPISACVTGWVDIAVSSFVLLVMMACFGVLPTRVILLAPAFLALASLTALGVSLWLSALDIRYHDIRYTVPFLTQVWMFLSPVIIAVTLIQRKFGIPIWLYGLNPMASVIVGYRWAMGVGPAPTPYMVLCSCAVILTLLLSGLWYFKRTERFFADLI